MASKFLVEVFFLLKQLKNLAPSIFGIIFLRQKPVIAELCKTDLHICLNFGRVNFYQIIK